MTPLGSGRNEIGTRWSLQHGQELLDKLEKAEAKLAQTELDLTSEQNVRRTLQAEVVEAKERESAMAQRQVR
jgi:hypothetical protein